jgi:hypothetical protein
VYLPKAQLPISMVTLDSSANNIPTTYGASLGSALFSSREPHKENFVFINNTSADVAISLDGATDHFPCPAGAEILVERVRVEVFYIRSLAGSAITDSATSYLSVW